MGNSIVESLEGRRLMAFGLTTTTSNYTVDTGAGVTFTVLRQGTTSTIHSGDLTSFKLNGVEFSAPYSSTSRYSHFESGLSNTSVVNATLDPLGNWISIACDDTTATTGAGGTGVIQYYIARKNDPNIYMATYAPEMKVSSTRFITYLDWTKFPNHPDSSDTSGGTGAIESGDVQGFADGTTASKYFGETRNIDHIYHGATGPSAGAFMFIGNRESGAGGPFWKDIDFQSTGAAVELYTMPYSGHSLTDAFRPGLHGPFALSLTNGSAPITLPDYSFIDGIGLSGWVSPSGRGILSGRATGVASGHIPTVALSNTEAQYWASPDVTGNYTISAIKPGTYTETYYDEELAVGTRTVIISAGQTTHADITATAYILVSPSTYVNTPYSMSATPIWRIGTWDGTPREFLNAEKFTIAHPTDSRLLPWADSTGMTNFTVGVDPVSSFPMAEWHTQTGVDPFYVDVQNRITFNLTSAQAATAMTLRIGVTRLDHGRPNISVNGGAGATVQNQTGQPDARGVTLGNWRGNNSMYSYSISTSSMHAGTNYIDIYNASGSTGTLFSGYHIYDAIDLIPTASATVPAVTSLTVSPGNATSIGLGGSRTFSAIAKDSTNTVRPANITWTALNGTINDAGEYIAPNTVGTDTITATYGSVTSSVTINIASGIPIIATPASASPNIVYYNSTTLSAFGSDDAGETALKYTWTTVGSPPAAVTFGTSNGTNAGKSLLASFTTNGTYTFQVTIADSSGNSTVSQTTVVVKNDKAFYKFDQPNGAALTDYSGNNSFGTVYGAFAFPSGVSNDALQLTGGAATLPTGIVAGLNDFTISAWVKPDALNNWARIFDFGTGTTSYMYLASRTSATGNPIRFAITTSGGTGEQAVNGPTLVNGVWTHLAITLSGNTATLYVNGVAAATNTSVTLRPSSLGNTNQNYLGESQFAADPTYLGSIDDFRIYSKALNSTEVSALAKPTVATIAASTPAPVSGVISSLSVLGADLTSGESTLTYTWSVAGTPPSPVTFSDNGTNTAKNITATFTGSGSYTFLVTITNAGGLSTTSTVNIIVANTPTSLAITQTNPTLVAGQSLQLTSYTLNQFAQTMTSSSHVVWTILSGGGSLDSQTGLYTADATSPTVVVECTDFILNSGTTTITIINGTPQITSATATPATVTGKTAQLAVTATDDAGESKLNYAWSVVTAPANARMPSFSTNANNLAKNAIVTFYKSGAYTLRVTATDLSGQTVFSDISLTVSQTLTSIIASPGNFKITVGTQQQFNAMGYDQFGLRMTTTPTFIWTSTLGTITSTGLYTAPTIANATDTISASSSGKTGSVNIITKSAGIPLAPSSLVAKAYSGNLIGLTWRDNSTNETSFEIQYGTGTSLSNIAWTTSISTTSKLGAISTVSYNFASPFATGANYYFRVRAINASGASVWSNIVLIKK